MKITNYTLPEFVFIDGNSHQGDSLEGRTVIVHIRSYTIIEVIALDEVVIADFSGSRTYKFSYLNKFGITEKHMFAVHYKSSHVSDLDLNNIFMKTAEWYTNYLRWEDGNIETDGISKLN